MIALARTIWTAIASRRDWLTLLAVALVAAVLYVKYEQVRRQRDIGLGAMKQFCAIVGEPIVIGVDVRPGSGAACADRARQLARFERDALAQSNRLLAEHRADQLVRADRDIARAADDAATVRNALMLMEKQNAAIAQDHVAGPWFDALNRLAGMRNESGGAASAGGDRGEAGEHAAR